MIDYANTAAFYNHPKVQEARRLLVEAERELRNEARQEAAKHLCECGHERQEHGPSYSINYTEGICKQCKCLHFIMQRKEV
jgi:hypothetical protein